MIFENVLPAAVLAVIAVIFVIKRKKYRKTENELIETIRSYEKAVKGEEK